MNSRLVRDVIARYQEDVNERPLDKDMDWMEYQTERTKSNTKIPDTVNVMLSDVAEGDNPMHLKTLGKPFDTYNPYDYKSPNDMPKNIKDSPPFINEVPSDIDVGLFSHPDMFERGGPLEEWYRSRRIDWTDDPDTQSPAISIDRGQTKKLDDKRCASVIAQYMLQAQPFVIREGDLDELGYEGRTAASMNEILTEDKKHYKSHLKPGRAAECSVIWANRNKKEEIDTGKFIFRVRSVAKGDKTPDTRLVYFQFLRGDDEGQYKSYGDYPVQISCSCPSFLWYGAQYYAIMHKYLYYPGFRVNPGTVLAPTSPSEYRVHVHPTYPKGKRHPGRGFDFRVCKHILAAFNEIKRYKITNTYHKYPITAPPSAIINPEVWKKNMKFEFTEDEIKRRLNSASPSVPAFFSREGITPSVIKWFNENWIPRDDNAKIKVLEEMVESPERIYFILIKEAFLKRARKEKISDKLIDAGYDLMAKTILPDNKLKPQIVKAPGVPEDQTPEGRGTMISQPGGDIDTETYLKKDEVEYVTEDSIREMEKEKKIPSFKRRDISKALRGISESVKDLPAGLKSEAEQIIKDIPKYIDDMKPDDRARAERIMRDVGDDPSNFSATKMRTLSKLLGTISKGETEESDKIEDNKEIKSPLENDNL